MTDTRGLVEAPEAVGAEELGTWLMFRYGGNFLEICWETSLPGALAGCPEEAEDGLPETTGDGEFLGPPNACLSALLRVTPV